MSLMKQESASKNRVLVLGAAGMLGHLLFSHCAKMEGVEVFGSARSLEGHERRLPADLTARIRGGIEASNFGLLTGLLEELRPDTVVNCIGIVKQLPEAHDPVAAITINALLPHKLAAACRETGARLIHISTDCVFSGSKGNYRESDTADADDLYGRTKLLGEVAGENCITLRTSLIGHELKSRIGLVEWFLAQQQGVSGYANVIFSGFPTVEMAHIITDYVIPNRELSGLYHLSSAAISKYDLLVEIAGRYGRKTELKRSAEPHCDRSLNSDRFREATGYVPPLWHELVEKMHRHYQESALYGRR